MRFRPPRAVFQEIDEALGESLSRLMFEGEESELTLTRNAQPALMAVSVAVVRALEAEAPGGSRSALPSSPAIRLANTLHLPLRGAWRWPTRHACFVCGARLCNRRSRWAPAQWPR